MTQTCLIRDFHLLVATSVSSAQLAFRTVLFDSRSENVKQRVRRHEFGLLRLKDNPVRATAQELMSRREYRR
jgi:hypothetical protein